MTKKSSRPVKPDPIPCSVEEPCKVCSGMSHPCYTRGEELWCAFIESEKEIDEFTPVGYVHRGTVPKSGQQVFVPIEIERQRQKRLKTDPGDSPSNTPTDEEQALQRELLKELAGYSTERLNLRHVFNPIIASALIQKAESLPVAPEYLMQPFLAVCAGVVGTRAKIQLKRGWVEPAIVWTGLIGDPGTMKSPALAAIQKPLIELQRTAKLLHEDAQIDYDDRYRKWDAKTKEERSNSPDQHPGKPPEMRHYYMDRFTSEALLEKHATESSKTGFSLVLDELSGLFSGMDQYKANGKGDARQTLLTLWTGGALKSDRVTKELFISESCISITGGIQRRVLEKLMSDADDSDGMWGRFLWADPPQVPDVWVDTECDINDLLTHLYRVLDSLPERTYTLSAAAKERYKRYVNWLAEQKEWASDALKNVLSKLKGYAARIAVVLHCIDQAVGIDTDPLEIPESTLQRAFRLCMYYLHQVKLLHGQTVQSQLPPDLLRVVQLSQQVGWVSDRMIQRKLWTKTAADAKSLLLQLYQLGLGKVEAEGQKALKWIFDESLSKVVDRRSTNSQNMDLDTEPVPADNAKSLSIVVDRRSTNSNTDETEVSGASNGVCRSEDGFSDLKSENSPPPLEIEKPKVLSPSAIKPPKLPSKPPDKRQSSENSSRNGHLPSNSEPELEVVWRPK